jgi:O-antigen ligase/tetratricopeptide (TPR) repeat protein
MSELKSKRNRLPRRALKNKSEKFQASWNTRLQLYLPRSILVLGCFVLALPLAFNSQYYYPYVFFKCILFRVAVQAMALLYTLLALTSPSHRPRFHRLTYALLAYFGVLLLCSLPGISVSAWNSWWGDFARMGGMVTQLHLLVYFFVLTQTLKQERHWLTLLGASLFFGILMGFTGLVQHYGLGFLFHFSERDGRIQGVTGNPNFYAAYMLLSFFIAFYFFSRRDKNETYPIIAKTWLVLLIVLALYLVFYDTAAGGDILSLGMAFSPISIFAFLLHGIVLFWYWKRRNVYTGMLFLSVLGLYYLFWMYQSQTRAAIVGLAGSFAFLSILYVFAGTGKRTKCAAALVILLVILRPGGLWINRHSHFVRSQPLLARLTRTSLEENRFKAWKAAGLGILDHPVLGWGLENYNKAFDRNAPASIFSGANPENWYDRAHNSILDIGTTAGCMGLAAYLIFYVLVFAFLISHWLKTRDTARYLSIAGLLVAYQLQGLFTFDTINTDGILFLTLAYVAFLYGGAKPDLQEVSADRPEQSLISPKNGLILAATAAVLICCSWYFVKLPRDSNLLLNYGIALEKEEGSQPNTRRYVFREALMHAFQQADDLGTTGRYQVREEFANYASALARASYIPHGERFRVDKMAVAMLEKSIPEDPLDARHYMYLASLVNRTFETLKESDSRLALSLAEKNLALLQKAETLGPKGPQVFLERAQSLVFIGRTDDAISALQKAIAVAPIAEPPHVDLAALYISAGRYADAQREWQTIKDLSLPVTAADYDRLIGLFVSKKKFMPAVDLYKEQLRSSPNNPLLLARLAAVYRELGDLDSARQTAHKAAALSPQIADQLEDFLKSLNR